MTMVEKKNTMVLVNPQQLRQALLIKVGNVSHRETRQASPPQCAHKHPTSPRQSRPSYLERKAELIAVTDALKAPHGGSLRTLGECGDKDYLKRENREGKKGKESRKR